MYFEYHIAREGANMSKVADRVGLERTHLYRKLKQLGVKLAAARAVARRLRCLCRSHRGAGGDSPIMARR